MEDHELYSLFPIRHESTAIQVFCMVVEEERLNCRREGDNLRKEWHLWMANDGAGETTAGNLRRAKYSAWKNISNETIINSFVSCGITDSLNSDHEELEISDIDDTS
ncbi:20126_t:CDS:2 [Rhizophagus irregularis]|nr:20126_t:CDS:2 [Rhizophagus irregularis]